MKLRNQQVLKNKCEDDIMGKINIWSNEYHCFVTNLNGLLYSKDCGKTWKKMIL